MIPKKLTLQGFLSYQDPQEIDFTVLNKAKLFGIFGKVGAGKSAILDAISLALYGEVERLNKHDKRGYNLMNLNSDQLFISFEMTHGNPEKSYKFEVKAKRNRKQFMEVKTFDRVVYELTEQGWLSLPHQTAEPILGLTYPHFKRSMILPQGKFQEFLLLKAADRTQMMKDIFDLHRFDLGLSVDRLSKENELKLQHLEGQLAMFSDTDTPQHLKSLAIDLKIKSKDHAKLEKTLEKQEKEQLRLQTLKIDLAAQEKAQNSLTMLLAKSGSITEKSLTLKRYLNCQQHFKDLLTEVQTYQHIYDGVKAHHEEKKGLLTKKMTALSEAELGLNELLTQQSTLKTFQLEIDQLDILIQEQQLLVQAKEKTAASQALHKQYQDAESNKLSLKNEIVQLQKTLAEQEKNQPNHQQIYEIKAWFDQKKYLEKVMADERSKAAELKGVFQQKYQSLRLKGELLSDVLDQRLPSDLTALLSTLQASLEQHKQNISQAQKKLDNLNVAAKLQEYAHNIQANEACPLCGSTEHPDKIQVADHTQEIASKKANILQMQVHSQALITLIQQAKTLLTDETQLAQKNEASAATLQQYQNNLTKHLKSFNFDPYTPQEETRLLNIEKKAAESQAAIQKSAEALLAKNQALEALETRLGPLKQQLTEAQKDKARMEGAIESYEAQVSLEAVSQLRGLSSEKLIENKLEKEKYIAQVTREVGQKTEQVNEIKQQVKSLEGECLVLKQKEADDHVNFVTRQQELSRRIEAQEMGSVAAVQALLNSTLNIEKLQTEIDTYTHEKKSLEGTLKDLDAKIKKQVYDEALHAQLVEMIEEEKATLKTLVEAIAVITQQSQQLTERLKTKDSINATHKNHKERQENLDLLKKCFKGSGFVNFVSAQFLEALCHSANTRFHKLTKQQLKLVMAEDNQFQVIDYLNGGRTRHIKTLSGGQLFQASFSMALALADHIQAALCLKDNFFFLDEGFGTLDGEALEEVLEALRGLHKENRVVGVISHVGALQEAIEARVLVEKVGERSQIF